MEIILQYIPSEVWQWIGIGVIVLSALSTILKSIRQILVACKKLAAMTSTKSDDAVLAQMIGSVESLMKWVDEASDFLGDLLRARPKTIGALVRKFPDINRNSRY